MQNLLSQLMTVILKLVDVVETLTKLDSLFGRNNAVSGNLNLRKRSFAASVNELCNVKLLAGMSKNGFADGTGRFSIFLKSVRL